MEAILHTDVYRLVENIFINMKLIDVRDFLKKGSGHYHVLNMARTYVENEKSYFIAIDSHLWRDIVIKISEVYDYKIGIDTLSSAILSQLDNYKEFPLKDYVAIIEATIRDIEEVSKTITTAFLPLVALNMDGVKTLPLANSILKSIASSDYLNHRSKYFHQQNEQFLETILELEIYGDYESSRLQVEVELNNSLMLLRYLYPWNVEFGHTGLNYYTSASSVNIRPDYLESAQPFTQIFVHNKHKGTYGEFTFMSTYVCEINNRIVSDFYKVYNLDDFNYHFKQTRKNEVSQRIIRAMHWYDRGVQSLENWEALTNYVL
jgi:hypothetical protein